MICSGIFVEKEFCGMRLLPFITKVIVGWFQRRVLGEYARDIKFIVDKTNCIRYRGYGGGVWTDVALGIGHRICQLYIS